MVYYQIRKRLLSYSLIALGVLTIISCTDEVVERDNPVPSNGKLSGVIDNGLIQTYTSLGGTTGDASRTINWNSGDEVHFLAITNGTEVSDLGNAVAEDINGVNANFVVTPPVFLTNYMAFYPSSHFTSGIGSYEGKATLSIPTVQTYVADGISDDTYPMIAVGTVSPLKFKGVAGVLRFELTGETGTTIDKIVFRSAGVRMSGVSDWIDPLTYVEGSRLTFTTTSACDSVVLSCPSTALSSTPVSFYIVVADTIYPATTTEISIEGSYGRKVYTASQPIIAETNRISARSLFYGSYDQQREYDAHFIVGDTLELGATFLNASVTGGGNWLTLSVNAPYKESEQTQNYSGSAPLFVHLDENLTGSERSALITATRSNGSILKMLVKQQSAIYAGPFGNYGGVSVGGPSEGAMDDSGQATPFSMELRSGGKGYTKKMYVEAIPEYVTSGVQFASTSVSSYSGSNKHLGLVQTKASYDKTKYSTYASLLYQTSAYPAINYCASKNRDINGDGILSEDEIKWYMPAINQSIGMWITDVYNNTSVYTWDISIPYWTATKGSNIYNVNYTSGTYLDAGISGTEYYGVRCVRDGEDVNHTAVSVDLTGNPVIDLSSLPTDVTTNTSKGIAMGDEHSEINKTVYEKLRVAKKDSKQNGAGGYEAMTWSKAVGLPASFENSSAINETTASGTGCAEYYEESDASDKGTWRLPTQREMQAIWMWKDELENISGFDAFSNNGNGYWTATEAKSTSTKAFVVSLHSAYSEAVLKSGIHLVRCVRESLNMGNYLYTQQDTVNIIWGNSNSFIPVYSSDNWMATVDQAWCTAKRVESGQYEGYLGIACGQNSSGFDRFAVITINNGSLTKTVLVHQRAASETYITMKINSYPYVKVSNGQREIVSSSKDEMMMNDVVVFVYGWDGGSVYPPHEMYYIPNVNDTVATISMKTTSGTKRIFVAANTGAANPIVYNNGAIATSQSIANPKAYNSLNHVLASSSSGFNVMEALSFSSGVEGGGEGLIKTMAGGAYGISNGMLQVTGAYTGSGRFFMSNWAGPNINTANETLTSDCVFTVYPDVPSEESQNTGGLNHLKIGLQRGISKVSFRITADGETTNETAGYAGPYYSSEDDGSKGRFEPLKVGGKPVWSLGGINKHQYPFQTFNGIVVMSPNYYLSVRDTLNTSHLEHSTDWYASYDNTRIIGIGKNYGQANFGSQHVKEIMLTAGNYTFVSDANGNENTNVYAFCTENGTEYPQVRDRATYVVIGGVYHPRNVITAIQKPAVTTNPAEKGWNGTTPVVNMANAGYNFNTNTYFPIVYGAEGSDMDVLYYLRTHKIFIHGKDNLFKYYAWELKYDKDTDTPAVSLQVAEKIKEDVELELLRFYNQGLCFYKMYVADSSVASFDSYENQYLVRRNFIYDMKLDKIQGPGDPFPYLHPFIPSMIP